VGAVRKPSLEAFARLRNGIGSRDPAIVETERAGFRREARLERFA
jgi:hypothetical protein